MQKIILGRIKFDDDLTNSINESFEKAQETLAKNKINISDDFVFFGQWDTDFSQGLEYDRHHNFIEVILRESDFPKQSTIELIIMKAAVEQFIDANSIGNFDSSFIESLYRSGAGLCFAHQNSKDRLVDDLSAYAKDKLLDRAGQALVNSQKYNPEEWFCVDCNLEYPIWSLGELIISELLTQHNKELFQINQQDIQDWFSRQ